MVWALVRSVFRPRSLRENERGDHLLLRRGWLLIVLRWSYYSLLFCFRAYHGRWMPFSPPPFGLDIDTYAALQRVLALPFGLLLMGALALALWGYLRRVGREIPFAPVLNILGVTFFLPFVIVQPIDQGILLLWGWELVPVSVAHTAILIWESWAAVTVLSLYYPLARSEKIIGGILLTIGWILLTGPVWR